MFETAQWVLGSDAAHSLAQIAARSANGSPQLAGLVRERQDLVNEWLAKDKQLIAAKSELPTKRKPEVERALTGRLAAIDTRLAEIDRRLARDYPDHAAFASPAPVSVAEVQAHLGADEALVLLLDTPKSKSMPEETFIWVVTKTDVRWVRSDLGTEALAREVMALRCGLDGAAWYGNGAEKCTKLLPGSSAPRCQPTAALRSFPRAQASRGLVRQGAGPRERQTSSHRAIRSTDAAPLPGAHYEAADFERSSGGCLARPRARHYRLAHGRIPESAASGRQAQHCTKANGRLRQSATRRARCSLRQPRQARPRKAALPGDALAAACGPS